MKWFKHSFFTGAKLLIPIFFTTLVILWLLNLLDQAFAKLIFLFGGENIYFPGLGLLFSVLLMTLLGSLIRGSLHSWIESKIELVITKIPIIKTVYKMATDVFKSLSRNGIKTKGQVVSVQTPAGKLLGILTKDEFDTFPDGFGEDEEVYVYFPMSYQIGGYSLLVSKEVVTPLDISVEEAFGLVMTAGLSSGNQRKK